MGILLVLSLFVYNETASAACVGSGFQYGNISGNPAAQSQVVTDGATCTAQVRFFQATHDSASIVKKPKNGDLTQINVYTFEYNPKKNFKGTDEYVVKFCGAENTGAKGCVTVSYFVTIK